MELIEGLRQQWRFGPPIEWVGSPQDLARNAPADALGAYDGARVMLVKGLPPLSAARVAAHEAIGHHSPRQLLGRAWEEFAADVNEGAQHDPQVAFFRAHVREVYGDDMRLVDVADETIAAAAEWCFCPSRGQIVADRPVRARLSALLRHAGRRWLHLRLPVTNDELEGVLLAGERRLWRRGTWLHRAFWGGYAPPMVKPMGPANPARDLEESEALLRAARSRDGWREELLVWIHGATLLTILGAIIWGAFSLIASWW